MTKKAIDKREAALGKDLMAIIFRVVCLKTIDSAWLAHLETMEHLREGIGLRGYGQRDPLVEYKAEAFRLFNSLQNSIRAEVVTTALKAEIQSEPQQLQATETEITEGAERAQASMQQAAKKQTSRVEVRTRTKKAAAQPNLKPMRKKPKKKKKKR